MQALLSNDYGPAGGCWSKGNAAASAGTAGPFTGLLAGASVPEEAADAAAELPAPQDLSGTTGRPRAADAAVDSARDAIPFEELRAERIRLRALP